MANENMPQILTESVTALANGIEYSNMSLREYYLQSLNDEYAYNFALSYVKGDSDFFLATRRTFPGGNYVAGGIIPVNSGVQYYNNWGWTSLLDDRIKYLLSEEDKIYTFPVYCPTNTFEFVRRFANKIDSLGDKTDVVTYPPSDSTASIYPLTAYEYDKLILQISTTAKGTGTAEDKADHFQQADYATIYYNGEEQRNIYICALVPMLNQSTGRTFTYVYLFGNRNVYTFMNIEREVVENGTMYNLNDTYTLANNTNNNINKFGKMGGISIYSTLFSDDATRGVGGLQWNATNDNSYLVGKRNGNAGTQGLVCSYDYGIELYSKLGLIYTFGEVAKGTGEGVYVPTTADGEVTGFTNGDGNTGNPNYDKTTDTGITIIIEPTKVNTIVLGDPVLASFNMVQYAILDNQEIVKFPICLRPNGQEDTFDKYVRANSNIANPTDSLIDLKWFPVDLTKFTKSTKGQMFINGEAISNDTFNKLYAMRVECQEMSFAETMRHIDMCRPTYFKPYYNDYRDYTLVKYHLYLPFIGTIDLDNDKVVDCRISVKYILDFKTGLINATVLSNNVMIACNLVGRFGFSFPVVGNNNQASLGNIKNAVNSGANLVGAIASAGTSLGSLAMGSGDIAGNVNAVGNVITSAGATLGALNSIGSTYPMVSGSFDDMSAIYYPMRCIMIVDKVEHINVADDEIHSIWGKPTLEKMTLSSGMGYIKCSDVKFDSINTTAFDYPYNIPNYVPAEYLEELKAILEHGCIL